MQLILSTSYSISNATTRELDTMLKNNIVVVVIIILPSVANDPEGCEKLHQLQKNYKISWNDLPPHQQSSHEIE